MTLTDFLYAADALRLEEGVGFHVETPGGMSAPAAPVPSPADVKAQNARSMQALMGMMGGLQNAPGKKKR
jgi:hypothetical protein